MLFVVCRRQFVNLTHCKLVEKAYTYINSLMIVNVSEGNTMYRFRCYFLLQLGFLFTTFCFMKG